MDENFKNVIEQLIEKIDSVNYDLQSFVAGFVYGMQIGKALSTAINDQINSSNDFISKKILQHYNFEVKNENLSSREL